LQKKRIDNPALIDSGLSYKIGLINGSGQPVSMADELCDLAATRDNVNWDLNGA
jgi:hypothetical protein